MSAPMELASASPLLSTPFDGMAADYDEQFTDSLLGRLMRQAVWQRMDTHFQPGDRILELNCGTGEDALHLAKRGVQVLATDISSAMVQVAREKVAHHGLNALVDVQQLPIESMTQLLPSLPNAGSPSAVAFDGALSNFGGLNCVRDLESIASALAACLRPGATALLCIMGPVCPWEWGWYLRKGQPAKAFRRLRRGGVSWRGLTIHYPSVRKVRRAFAPAFRLRRASAVGALLPPTYVEEWALRHARLIALLNRWERRIEAVPVLPQLADHYLLELERV